MTTRITLYSDFVCPFCYVAEASTVARLERELGVTVDWRGFELHPETPSGGTPVTAFGSQDRLDDMRSYIRDFAARFGIGDLATPDRIPNTRRALAVAELAREQGKLDEFRKRAMAAHWHESMNLEDDDDIAAIASAAGMSPDDAVRAMDDARYLERVDAMRVEATRMGVTGIPTFFVGDEVVVGCQPYDVLDAAVRRASAAKSTALGAGA